MEGNKRKRGAGAELEVSGPSAQTSSTSTSSAPLRRSSTTTVSVLGGPSSNGRRLFGGLDNFEDQPMGRKTKRPRLSKWNAAELETSPTVTSTSTSYEDCIDNIGFEKQHQLSVSAAVFNFDSFFGEVDSEVDNIPLVSLEEGIEQDTVRNVDALESNSNKATKSASSTQHWPMKPDSSSTFSILLRGAHRLDQRPLVAMPSASTDGIMATITNNDSSEVCDNNDISQFVDDSLVEEPCSTSANTTTDKKKTVDWTSRYSTIPICGFRNRAELENFSAPNFDRPMQARFMAVLNTVADTSLVHYQQALQIAAGLNKRSLWTGMASQMVGGERSFDD